MEYLVRDTFFYVIPRHNKFALVFDHINKMRYMEQHIQNEN